MGRGGEGTPPDECMTFRVTIDKIVQLRRVVIITQAPTYKVRQL